jgi:hypothetical protein
LAAYNLSAFGCYGVTSLVYPTISDSIEIIIRKHIAGIKKLRHPQYGDNTTNTTPEEEAAAGVAVIMNNPVTENHFELQIKTLKEAPRDPDKLRELLKVKQKGYEKATDSEDIERLVTEIEMLQFVLFLVCRDKRKKEDA